jgi:hypothetical protein
LRQFGNVKRVDEHGIPKRLLEMKMSGRRPMGKPQIDQIKRYIKNKMGMEESQ